MSCFWCCLLPGFRSSLRFTPFRRGPTLEAQLMDKPKRPVETGRFDFSQPQSGSNQNLNMSENPPIKGSGCCLPLAALLIPMMSKTKVPKLNSQLMVIQR